MTTSVIRLGDRAGVGPRGATAVPRAVPAREGHPWKLYLLLFALIAMAVSFIWGYAPDSFYDQLGPRLQDLHDGNSERRVAMPLLSLLGAYWIWQQNGAARLRVRTVPAWLLIAFLSIAAASVLWTDDLTLSIRRVAVVSMLFLVVFGAALRFSATQAVAMCAVVCGGTCLCALGSDLWTAQFAPWSGDYRFAGVMHPNLIAANCAVATIAALAWSQMASTEGKRRLLLAASGFLFVLLVLTKSRTATGSGFAAVLIYLTLTGKPTRVLGGVLALGVLASAGTLLFGEALFTHLHDAAMLGRGAEAAKSTLSNRLPLWAELFDFIARRPLTGYGYGAFWSVQRTIAISAHQGWVIPHAHNSYIEMTLETGVVGGLVYATMMASVIWRAWGTAWRTRRPEYVFVLAILLYFALNMCLEAFDFDPTEPPFAYLVLFVQCAFVAGWGTVPRRAAPAAAA